MRSIAERLVEIRRKSAKLNPLIFEDGKLKPIVREKILAIVDEFIEYTQLEDMKILDIRLVGSNAGFNYHPGSDLDIHIVTDLSKISKPETIARLYFDSVKKNFKDTYNIKIKGIDVELYVEDVRSSANSNGIYSVTKDKWIKNPSPEKDPTPEELQKSKQLEDEIIQRVKNTKDADEVEDIIDDIYLMRKDSLSAEGETGPGNLAFKSLRNRGILDQLKDAVRKETEQELSLESKQIEEDLKVSKMHPDKYYSPMKMMRNYPEIEDIYDQYKTHKNDKGIEKRFKISDLYTAQPFTDMDSVNSILSRYKSVEDILKMNKDEPITVVRYHDKDVLVDGNYRTSAIKKLGSDYVVARFIDLDNQ